MRHRIGPWAWLRTRLGFGAELARRPFASRVLTAHLESCQCPHWTAFFVRYDAVRNDQFGWSHFNWAVAGGQHNYHVLRLGCFPFVKYHCSRRPRQDLAAEDALFRVLKCLNAGLPSLLYGLAAIWMARHQRQVLVDGTTVTLYFWYREDLHSPH